MSLKKEGERERKGEKWEGEEKGGRSRKEGERKKEKDGVSNQKGMELDEYPDEGVFFCPIPRQKWSRWQAYKGL